jgi:hypothetical protein
MTKAEELILNNTEELWKKYSEGELKDPIPFIKNLLQAANHQKEELSKLIKDSLWNDIDRLQHEFSKKDWKEVEKEYKNKKEASMNGLEKAKDLLNDF